MARRDTLNANLKTYQEIDQFQLENSQDEWAFGAASLPPEYQQRYLNSTTISGLLNTHEAGIVARERATAKVERDKLESEWSDKLEKEVAAHSATRTGAPGAGPAPNGSNGTGGGAGILTLARYNAMSTPERMKLTSAQRDDMMARHLAERNAGR